MSTKTDRFLTVTIIIIALAGISYFGVIAFSGSGDEDTANPFEYNIDYFKSYDPQLNQYTEQRQIPLEFKKLFGLAIGPDDELYVSGDTDYLIYDQEGNLLRSVSCGQAALCLTVDTNKDVYLGMTDHVQIFSGNGEQKSRWKSTGEKSIFTSVAITSNYVYVADAGQMTVWQFDKNGDIVKQIGEKNKNKDIPGFIIPSPYFDVAVDPDGFLWAANTGRLTLENYSADGSFRSTWGTPGMKIEEFCGCCNPSHFIINSNGDFITGEKGIARVKVYNRLGELISVVAGPDEFNEGTVGIDLAVDSHDRVYVLDPMRKQVRIFEKRTDT